MNMIDVGLFLLIILFAILGWKRGVIKSLVRLVGLVVIAIVAYSLKGTLANFLIDFMPFINFGGAFEDVQAINILFYNGVSFLFIFVILYCILNILVNIAGIFDKILKATIILYLPDKILGLVVGVIEGVIVSFIVIFTLAQIPLTQNYVYDSNYASKILNRTPVIRTVLADMTLISEEINEAVEGTSDIDTLQVEILNIMIKYQLTTKEEVEKLIESEKINLTDVTFS